VPPLGPFGVALGAAVSSEDLISRRDAIPHIVLRGRTLLTSAFRRHSPRVAPKVRF
jgi:hypothetical protein